MIWSNRRVRAISTCLRPIGVSSSHGLSEMCRPGDTRLRLTLSGDIPEAVTPKTVSFNIRPVARIRSICTPQVWTQAGRSIFSARYHGHRNQLKPPWKRMLRSVSKQASTIESLMVLLYPCTKSKISRSLDGSFASSVLTDLTNPLSV